MLIVDQYFLISITFLWCELETTQFMLECMQTFLFTTLHIVIYIRTDCTYIFPNAVLYNLAANLTKI